METDVSPWFIPTLGEEIPLEISFAHLDVNSSLEVFCFLVIYHTEDPHFQLDPVRKTGQIPD